MLDANLLTALKGYLERLVQPIEIVTYADASENSRQMLELVADVASVAPAGRLSVRAGDTAGERTPSFQISQIGADTGASPACRWGMSSPRWCWRCCRPAATQPRSRLS